jgi:hypothetical protein
MSQSLTIDAGALLRESDRQSTIEQLPFVFSPFGILPTTIAIFVLVMSSYLLVAVFGRVPLFTFENHHPVTSHGTRVAFALSVLITTTLAVQRYARIKDCAEAPLLARVVRGRFDQAYEFTMVKVPTAVLVFATLLGLISGVAASFGLADHAPFARFYETPLTFYWFLLANGIVWAFFARGVVHSVLGGRKSRRSIDRDLVIDLLRIDELSVIGRSAGRVSFIWFACTAAACLLFIGGEISPPIIVLLIACAAMGIGIFVVTMERVHRRIVEAKSAELRDVRNKIDQARAKAHTDADASIRLQGLLAYEARIHAAPEWPFDQPTLVRVGASTLILTVPWFGQAVAGYLVENANKLFH